MKKKKSKWPTQKKFDFQNRQLDKECKRFFLDSLTADSYVYRPLHGLRILREEIGGKYVVFVSSRSVKMRGFSFLSLYKSLFIFQFLNVKIYNYGKQNIIVNFIIKKLKKTQFPQKV